MIPNDGNYPRIIRVEFSPLPSGPTERISKLAEHGRTWPLRYRCHEINTKRLTDSFLHAVISSLEGDKYTVLYTTSPPAEGQVPASKYSPAPVYEMDDQYALHTDLKRDLDSHAGNSTRSLPLFDTYQFLSPGNLPHLFSCSCDGC